MAKAGKDGVSKLLKSLTQKFRVGSDYKHYLHPHKLPGADKIIPEIPVGNKETEYNTSFYKRKDLTLTEDVENPHEEDGVELPLAKGEFPGHLPTPRWTQDEAILKRMISDYETTGLMTCGYFNDAKDDDFIHIKEVYGEGVYGEHHADYFDLTKSVLRARTRCEEDDYKNDKHRGAIIQE